MRESKMPLTEILAIVIQVTEALDAAHESGIIHRDIKPENIMLRKDGYVKVLDFGLAKLAEKQSSTRGSDIQTLSETQPGVVIGTVRYMSPEQARGLAVDSRTDIFSLAVVLYELISGKPPFDGATSTDTLAAILHQHPTPLHNYGEFPEELQWILTKALAKEADERYQSAKELLTDLKRVKKQLEIEQELKRSGPLRIAQPVHKTTRRLAVVSIILVALIASAFLLLTQRKSEQISTPKKPFSKIKFTRLTSTGLVYGGEISPDGKYVAYVQRSASGQQSLYLKQLAVDSEINIITLPSNTFFYRPRQRAKALCFSPDGEHIYYLTSSVDQFISSLHRIPVLGGISQKLVEEIDMVPTFSPDGKKIAFLRTVQDEIWVVIAQADGSDQRKIRTDKSPPAYYEDIEWSPEGKLLALIKGIQSSNTSKQIVGINLNDFSERTLFDTKLVFDIWYDDLQWVSDGSGLIFTKSVEGERQIYHISTSTGKLTSITNDLNDYMGVSLTKDNRSIVTTQRVPNWTLWAASSTHPSDMTQLTSGSNIEDGARGISWTNDGQIIYESKGPTGDFQFCLINPDGTNRKRITTGKAIKRFPVCSSDGRYIVYTSEEGALSKIFRMDRDGSNLQLLSGTKLARWPQISPDSKWVIYSTFGGNNQELVKVELDGAHQTSLASHKTIFGLAISPNGSQIAYAYIEPQKSPDLVMSIISSKGGPSLKSFRLHEDTFPGRFHWTPDGSGIAYILQEKGGSNIYVQPVDGSSPRRLTNLTAEMIVNFSWSLDGKRIAYSRGKRNSDIVLIQDVP